MLNPIGPSVPLQVKVLTSPNPFTKLNHFEEELLEENGLFRDLPKDRTEIEVLLDGGGGSIRMFVVDRLLLQKLKKKCNLQEKTLERLSESLHVAIKKNKVIPNCANWNYVKVFNFSIFN
jgi:hypothetical protein